MRVLEGLIYPLEDTNASSQKTVKEGHPWWRVLPVQSHGGLKSANCVQNTIPLGIYRKQINCGLGKYQQVHGVLFTLPRHPSAEKWPSQRRDYPHV